MEGDAEFIVNHTLFDCEEIFQYNLTTIHIYLHLPRHFISSIINGFNDIHEYKLIHRAR